jgi:hypothetical protein
MTGEDAAKKMQAERGYVVIGFPPPLKDELPIPQVHTEFASAPLLFHTLLIVGKAKRKDWEQQAAMIFGPSHPACKKHPAQFGQRFFRCTLREVGQ